MPRRCTRRGCRAGPSRRRVRRVRAASPNFHCCCSGRCSRALSGVRWNEAGDGRVPATAPPNSSYCSGVAVGVRGRGCVGAVFVAGATTDQLAEWSWALLRGSTDVELVCWFHVVYVKQVDALTLRALPVSVRTMEALGYCCGEVISI